MKKIELTPVLTQKKSFLVLCLLGGLSALNIVHSGILPVSSHGAVGKEVHENEKYKNTNHEIRKAVTTMLAKNENALTKQQMPFVKNAYYKKESSVSMLTRIELGRHIRQEVALALAEDRDEIAHSSELSEDALAELIRQAVIRALSSDDQSIQKTESGWVYLGKFKDNKWLGCPLEIGNNMPVKGAEYTINGDVNIRKGSSAHQPVTDVLRANTLVELTDFIKRGNKGHYWAKVRKVKRANKASKVSML